MRTELNGSKLSEKYIAGFLDADGSIQIAWRPVDRADSNKELRRACLSLEFSQKQDQDKVLHLIADAIGGDISKTHGIYSTLKLFGGKAEMVLSRIKKYLVIKRHYAETCIQMHGKVFNKREAMQGLKAERRIKSEPLPNFPSRKWLAGYIDGDGCFHGRARKDWFGAKVVCEIACSDYDSEGIEIIRKNFGGSIGQIDSSRKHILKYCLAMPPSKAKQFLGYFAKHLVTKRDQAMFILGCAEAGNYRDGKRVTEILKQLKAHPHRLSDPETNVKPLIDSVDFNIETRREKFMRLHDENGGCIECGDPSVAYYSDGLCRRCYDKRRWVGLSDSRTA